MKPRIYWQNYMGMHESEQEAKSWLPESEHEDIARYVSILEYEAVAKERDALAAQLAETEKRERESIADCIKLAAQLAEAEVERAKGVAAANKIIGSSLKNNEEYLRYLWIHNLDQAEKTGQVIYVPTEAGLPILEAGKRK